MVAGALAAAHLERIPRVQANVGETDARLGAGAPTSPLRRGDGRRALLGTPGSGSQPLQVLAAAAVTGRTVPRAAARALGLLGVRRLQAAAPQWVLERRGPVRQDARAVRALVARPVRTEAWSRRPAGRRPSAGLPRAAEHRSGRRGADSSTARAPAVPRPPRGNAEGAAEAAASPPPPPPLLREAPQRRHLRQSLLWPESFSRPGPRNRAPAKGATWGFLPSSLRHPPDPPSGAG